MDTLRAIENPAPWASRPELPATDWSSYQSALTKPIAAVLRDAACPQPETHATRGKPLAFHCGRCGAQFAEMRAFVDHTTTGHNTAAKQRAQEAERMRARRAANKATPPPPPTQLARPARPPEPPTTREEHRDPVTFLAPSPALSGDLARAKARIAARHGTTPCTVCGTPKGAREGNHSDRPYRDQRGRCAACKEGGVLREQLSEQAG